MIQGQINSMIAQIGNMAHVGKTLRNTKTIKDTEDITPYLRRGIAGGKDVNSWAASIKSAKDVALANPWLKNKESWNYRRDWQSFMKDFNEQVGDQAAQATASDIQARIKLNSKVRKPSTVKAPGGNEHGK